MIPLLDTHQHLLYRRDLDYPWSNSLSELAGRDFTLEDYGRLTDGAGVAGTLFMEVDADDYQKEARLVDSLVKDPATPLVGMIVSCRPEENTGFQAWLDECEDLNVVGYRRILHEISDDLSQTDTFRANIRRIGQQGKVFDMCFRADQLAICHELATACSDMPLVLDHCGVPNIGGNDFESWSKSIANLAALPHVTCKLSGILAYCKPKPANQHSIAPYIDFLFENFGPHRLIWGSDWPVVNLGANLPTWIEVFRQMIAPLSADEQAAICHGNAERLYGVSLQPDQDHQHSA